MNTRIELMHPAGKKAVTIDTHKYETVRDTRATIEKPWSINAPGDPQGDQ